MEASSLSVDNISNRRLAFLSPHPTSVQSFRHNLHRILVPFAIAMANSEPKDEEPIRFCKPFDEEDADLIIRSSDNLHFRVHKFLLGRASPIFAGMFTIPLSGTSGTIQTVAVEERGSTMERFLHLCYPVGNADVDSLDAVSELLDVCDKYLAHSLAERLGRAELTTFIDTNPSRVYVLACRANAQEAARRAAYGCLALPLEKIVTSEIPELRHLSAPAYRSLLLYYHNCRQAAADALSCHKYPWISSDYKYCWFQPGIHKCQISYTTHYYYPNRPTSMWESMTPRKWWCDMISPIESYLTYQAPPLSTSFWDITSVPKSAEILQCGACKDEYVDDLHRFFVALEAEIRKRVKDVNFEFVG